MCDWPLLQCLHLFHKTVHGFEEGLQCSYSRVGPGSFLAVGDGCWEVDSWCSHCWFFPFSSHWDKFWIGWEAFWGAGEIKKGRSMLFNGWQWGKALASGVEDNKDYGVGLASRQPVLQLGTSTRMLSPALLTYVYLVSLKPWPELVCLAGDLTLGVSLELVKPQDFKTSSERYS